MPADDRIQPEPSAPPPLPVLAAADTPAAVQLHTPWPGAENATAVRYLVLALTAAMSVLLYLDRVCIAQLAPRMADDLALDKTQMGLIFGAFFLAYALAQVPSGWLGDRLGARVTLAACVLVWSLCTGLTALAVGLLSLAAVRLLFGVSQAGAYPTAARIIGAWMPLHRRAFANGVITLGGRAGGALAPLLTTALLLLLEDWRPVFVVFGLLGLVWTAVFLYCFRATPAEHPGCNRDEVELIQWGRPAQERDPGRPAPAVLPWSAVCRSRSLWMQCLTQFASNVPWAFLVTWLPTYLREQYQADLTRAGLLSSLTLLAGVVGCLLGGWATDRLTTRLGLKWGRNSLGMGSKFLAALALCGCLVAPNALAATLALACMSFALDTGLGATWAYFQDAGGRHVSTLLGWANMFGNLGAFVSPLLLGWLAEACGWSAALAVCTGLFVISGLAWFGVDARRPVVPEPEAFEESETDGACRLAAAGTPGEAVKASGRIR